MTVLHASHLEDLRRSGLNDATIKLAGFYTETDPAEISHILKWDRPAVELGPSLVLPFFHIDGHRNGFARIKPSNPRKNAGKYEQPAGLSPRALFTPSASSAAQDASVPLHIVEGEKKAWVMYQTGLAAVAICGVWAWQKKESDPRELIDDLATVKWQGRLVSIQFDTDPRRNPNVNHAAAELARVLTDIGALVHFVRFPVGPRGDDGLPGKIAADDFIVQFGPDAYLRLVEGAMSPPPAIRRLDDYRSDLARVRVKSVSNPGVYVDTSPTGAGKTYADMPAAAEAETSLTVLPTHKNCREVEEIYSRSGLDAAAYPELTRKTCQNYDEATKAIDAGLSASGAVCPACPFKDECDYRETLETAEAARHRIVTHKRAEASLAKLAEGRRYVTIHENPTDLLRPVAEVSCGLDKVVEVARYAKDVARGDNEMTLYHFFWRMESEALNLIEKLLRIDDTTPLCMPSPIGPPPVIDRRLYRAMGVLNIYPSADPMRIVKALVLGELCEITVRVDQVLAPGRQAITRKSIIAVWRTCLPDNAAVWLSDATADANEIETLVGRPVHNMTPEGRLEQRHDALQIPSDVKQSTSAGAIVDLFRGFFNAFPNVKRLGVICHRCHVSTIKGTANKGPVLDKEFLQRIAKIEHYRGGESRGSNNWLDECDMILVFGTPRVPPPAIKTRLIQTGRVAAASRDPKEEWQRDYWSGVTTIGKRRTVRTSAYRDHDWHSVHRAIVHAELLQAVGRGRGICENGIPVVVMSNEHLGLPLLEINVEPISDKAVQVLKAIKQACAQIPKGELPDETPPEGTQQAPPSHVHNSLNKYYLEKCALSSFNAAVAAGLRIRRAQYILNDLCRRGLVERVGQRGGWILSDSGEAFLSTGSHTQEMATQPAASA